MGLVKDLEKILDYPRGPNCHHRYANKLEIKGDLTQTQRRRPREDRDRGHKPRNAWGHEGLEEAERIPPQSLQREPAPADT